MKKVLFVVSNFNIGGPQKSLLNLINSMDREKYSVDILSLYGKGQLHDYLPEDVNIVEPDINHYLLTLPNPGLSFLKFLPRVNNFSAYKNLYRYIKGAIKGKFISSMNYSRQEYWLKYSKDLPRLNKSYDVAIGVSGGHSIMYVVDCVEAEKKIGWIRTDYRVLKRNATIDKVYFDKLDKIICVSHICRDILTETFPSVISNTEVMYNLLPTSLNVDAVDDNYLNYSGFKILTISRLDPNKGLELGVAAVKDLLEKGVKVKWFILGTGSYYKKIQKLIKYYNLDDDIILLGFKLDTISYLRYCDLYFHPSKFEGKSNAIDEAKYCCKPIVTTNFPTVKEQVKDNYSGLVANFDSTGISEKIEQVVRDKNVRSALVSNLRSEIKSEDESDKLNKFYNIIN
ncbi:glycosyltransferase [Alkalibacillus haloalkaliphilus]|uniref:Glycosyl transferase n=1 Tax=Alkalibacillus haloalkaliphilus TaxID=94136 RepID=A0A511W6F2_9BACI|nr:glycosyltransferase [Alkalibacillus haloalkaliphilus]GEN46666.1 glycosyl transferase [Alkalibacillus haloalkaliphilus]